jgi:methylated-DNA-[protein]-cysteine S-methyltransferase
MRTYTVIDSPVGALTLTAEDGVLSGVYMENRPADLGLRQDDGFDDAIRQFDEYFAGELTTFDLPTFASGNKLQRGVWQALSEIPYGETRSYGQIAERLGLRHIVRAVGAAIGQNPLLVVVPCHRVIGADGNLTGYAGGLQRKRQLLDLENPAASPVARYGDFVAARARADLHHPGPAGAFVPAAVGSPVRHGVSTVRSGLRHAFRLVFHDAE